MTEKAKETKATPAKTTAAKKVSKATPVKKKGRVRYVTVAQKQKDGSFKNVQITTDEYHKKLHQQRKLQSQLEKAQNMEDVE